jgi:hypothetical protein
MFDPPGTLFTASYLMLFGLQYRKASKIVCDEHLDGYIALFATA